MAVGIQLSRGSPQAGDSYCFVVCDASGSPPDVRVRVDGGSWQPVSSDPLGSGKFLVCVDIPPGARHLDIAVTDAAGTSVTRAGVAVMP